MIKKLNHKLIFIFLYLIPIIIYTLLLRTVSSFLLSGGIMTILLGLFIKFIPSYMKSEENSNALFISVSGILLIILALM